MYPSTCLQDVDRRSITTTTTTITTDAPAGLKRIGSSNGEPNPFGRMSITVPFVHLSDTDAEVRIPYTHWMRINLK
jgi:hypothetical protein